MRNWNILQLQLLLSLIACFYSTYEELKQKSEFAKEVNAIGFYSTYEELKPLSKDSLGQSKLGFYSTYEELKLFCVKCYKP